MNALEYMGPQNELGNVRIVTKLGILQGSVLMIFRKQNDAITVVEIKWIEIAHKRNYVIFRKIKSLKMEIYVILKYKRKKKNNRKNISFDKNRMKCQQNESCNI